MVKNQDFGGKMGVFRDLWSKIKVLWGLVENRGFGGKIEVFLKNGVFVGFWSRIREKVGKSREFEDFWKIGENREK